MNFPRRFAMVLVVAVVSVSAMLWLSMKPSGNEQNVLEGEPPMFFAWEQGKEDALLTHTFHVRSAGAYSLNLLFTAATDDRRDALEAFTGDGSYFLMSDASPNARKLVPFVDGRLGELEVRANRGEIVRRLAHPGARIWVQVSVTENKLGGQVLPSRTVETSGVSGYSTVGSYRAVVGVRLEPGSYRASALIESFPAIPAGIHTSVLVLPPRRW